MNSMFQYCHELEYLDLSNFDTSKVTNMAYMFNKCNKLEYLDLSSFNISNVTEMSFIFSECFKLKEIKGINKFITIMLLI